MRTRQWLSWLALTALMASVLALSLAAQDRTHLDLVMGLVAAGSLCALTLWWLDTQSTRAVLFYAVLVRLVLFHLPPSLSDDAYRYVWDGQVQSHGINPYRFAPQDPALAFLQEEPIFELLNSPAFYSVYPPVSQLIFHAGAQLTGSDGWAAHYAIKLILILAELLAVFLLGRMVTARYLILYALNPLVLLETAGQAHTESMLILLLVLAVLFHRRGQGGLTSIALGAAGWVKLFPFFFLPLLWRRYKWGGVWPGLVGAGVLALPFAAPYVIANAGASLDLYARYFEFNAGLYYTVKEFMRLLTDEDWSKQLGPLLRNLFLAGLPLLYALDYKFKWTLPRAMLILTGSYLVLTTTVHPWYLLSVIFLAALIQRPAWHWLWLGFCSVGTYQLYAGGPYWSFVVLGWGGWLALGLWRHGPSALQGILKVHAWLKFRHIRRYLPRHSRPVSVLDLGGAEGYVGQHVHRRLNAQVTLADIANMNRCNLPFEIVESDRLPWDSGRFDIVVLYFVLHHAERPEAVAREALRVCQGHVLIVESVVQSRASLRILLFLDRAANRLRAWRSMKAQERFLRFRMADEWAVLFEKLDGRLLAQERRGWGPLRSALYVVQPVSGEDPFPPSIDTRDSA